MTRYGRELPEEVSARWARESEGGLGCVLTYFTALLWTAMAADQARG
jgi:hypothetical protein